MKQQDVIGGVIIAAVLSIPTIAAIGGLFQWLDIERSAPPTWIGYGYLALSYIVATALLFQFSVFLVAWLNAKVVARIERAKTK